MYTYKMRGCQGVKIVLKPLGFVCSFVRLEISEFFYKYL